MKILYDHQIFVFQDYGGISRYFYELTNVFHKQKDIYFDLPLLYSNNQYVKKADYLKCKSFLEAKNFRGKIRLLNFIHKHLEKKFLCKKGFDIFHPTYYDPYFLKYVGDKPFVLTIYDMVYELFPQIFSPRDKTSVHKKLLASKATKIIAISENTKNDIIKLFGIKEDKIEVIYLGNPLCVDAMKEETATSSELPQRYLLFVGNRRVYKNFDIFIESISPLLKDDNSLYLICAGGGKFTSSEIANLEKSGVINKVTQCSFDDNILAQLYKNALAFIFPSLYEGFGIPILEAFSCGCPVVTSNISSLPEVAGDAAEYFDPTDKISILSIVKKVIDDHDLRSKLKYKGYERLKKFFLGKNSKSNKDAIQKYIMKTAIITGITGQDGAYLSGFLLNKNYKVIGIVRNASVVNAKNLKYLGVYDKIVLIEANLLDLSNIIRILDKNKPDEFYNLAAQSSVSLSFEQPIGTLEFNIVSVANILEAVKIVNPEIKFYQASSSEMFGNVRKENLPVNESFVFHPVSPYGISKAAAHWITVNYREAYGMFSACGILFNHESILRGKNFVTKKNS